MAEHSNQPSQTDVIHLLHRASQSADDLLAGRITNLSVTPRQLTVLIAVRSLSNASQTALVDRTGIDRSTLADIVRRLVEAGFLERERARHDARMYAVRLTDAGAELVGKAEPMRIEVAEHVLAGLAPDARTDLISNLSRIVDDLGPVASARVSPRSRNAAE
ncbi:MAG: MarR family winged helix-turn-helix transcriptional regulator [Pseudomonadota bacterium]